MTVSLSDYDQALLAQIGHFADTWLAEQVRAVMVARNNAEETVGEATRLRDLSEVRARFAEIDRDQALAKLGDAEATIRAFVRRLS